LVALTDGLVYPRTDIWKGKRRSAPEIPPIEAKKEIPKATRGGITGETSMPATGKYMALFEFQTC